MKKNNFTLSPKLPIALRGHVIASQEWDRVLRSPGLKITALDESLLIQYCLVIEDEQDLKSICTGYETTIKQLQETSQDKQLQRLIRKAQSAIRKMKKRICGKQKLAQDFAKSLYLGPPVFRP